MKLIYKFRYIYQNLSYILDRDTSLTFENNKMDDGFDGRTRKINGGIKNNDNFGRGRKAADPRSRLRVRFETDGTSGVK